jgi:hypothetical protein
VFTLGAAAAGDAVRAARLAGAATAIRDEAGMPLTGPDAMLLEDVLGAARADAGDDAWEQATAEGRALDRQATIALAREGCPP